MKFKIFCAAASLLLGEAFAIPASAATVDVNGFAPVTAKSSLSVTSTTARTALGYVGGNNTIVLHNSGSVDATVKFGDVTVVATDNDFPIPAGSWVTLNAKANAYIAYKTASSTTTVDVFTGSGGSPDVTGAATTSSGGIALSTATTATNTGTTATNTGAVATGIGAPGDTACATDNGTCAALALIKRTNQRITSLITALGTPFQASASIANTTFGLTPTTVTPTDRGSTIASGGVAQNAMASNASRKGGWVQNPCSATEDLFVSTSTTATTTGASDDADLAPCQSFSLLIDGQVIQTAVSVIAATTAHRYIAKEIQ